MQSFPFDIYKYISSHEHICPLRVNGHPSLRNFIQVTEQQGDV